MRRVLVFLLLIIPGVLIIGYPFYANYFQSIQVDGTIQAYQDSSEDTNRNERMLQEAEAYNRELQYAGMTLTGMLMGEVSEETQETDIYEQILDINQDGMMGIIRIPCINVRLPIYHGTSDEVLEKGVGHMKGTAFPVGGLGTHAVLTGHTGLSNAKLFTDLVQMEEGDLFILEMLGRKMAYRVCDIFVVEPTDVSKLEADPDKDLVTLVTCTPYGVNTHRLLIRGERTEYREEDEEVHQDVTSILESKWQKEYLKSVLIGVLVFLAIVFLGKRRRKKETPATENHQEGPDGQNNREEQQEMQTLRGGADGC